MTKVEKWEVIEEVSGAPQAELYRGLLEAQGISVVLSQEGLGHSVFSVTVGPLSEVQVLVPESQVEEARHVLNQYYRGEFESSGFNQGIDEGEPIDNDYET